MQPSNTHAPLARLALKAGRSVVCEKPLAATLVDAHELAALAASNSAVTGVPFGYRDDQTVREARQRIQRGDVGQVALMHGSHLQDWLSSSADVNWRVNAGHAACR